MFDRRIYCLASPGWILAEGAASLHGLTSSVGTRSPFNSFLLIHIFPSNRSRKMFLSKCLCISPRERLWSVLGALCPLVTSTREIWYWGREQGDGVIWAGRAVTTTISSKTYTDGAGFNLHRLPVNILLAQTNHPPLGHSGWI